MTRGVWVGLVVALGATTFACAAEEPAEEQASSDSALLGWLFGSKDEPRQCRTTDKSDCERFVRLFDGQRRRASEAGDACASVEVPALTVRACKDLDPNKVRDDLVATERKIKACGARDAVCGD